MVAQAAAHRLIACKPLREAMMRTDESTMQVHMTWVEDATKFEDKKCLQRDVTEVDVSRRGAGRTCLMFIVKRRLQAVVSKEGSCSVGASCAFRHDDQEKGDKQQQTPSPTKRKLRIPKTATRQAQAT